MRYTGQHTLFNNDSSRVDIDNINSTIKKIIEYPNLQEWDYLVPDFKNMMCCDIGDSFRLGEYNARFIEFNENQRPTYILNDTMYIMYRDDFTVHYYWVVVLLTIYIHRYCFVTSDSFYREVLDVFRNYKYENIVMLINDKKFVEMTDNGFIAPTTFIDIMYVLCLYNIDRLKPETLKDYVNRYVDSGKKIRIKNNSEYHINRAYERYDEINQLYKTLYFREL